MSARATPGRLVLSWCLLVAGCQGAASEPAPPSPSPVVEQAAPQRPPPAPPRRFVIVEDSDQPLARTPDGCTVLEVSTQSHSLKYRRGPSPQCPTFAAAQPLLHEMITTLNATGHLSGVTSFDVGRDYTAYFERLSLAAARSSAWDARTGKPKTGTSNELVVALSRDGAAFFPEITKLLEGTGLSPELRSVEKVLVGTPEQTPFTGQLMAAGAKPESKLPYDCILVFHLTKAAEPAP